MSEPLLQFDISAKIGKVISVDTSRVYIDVENHELLTRISVGNLVAVTGKNAHEYLVGIIERVSRQLGEEVSLEDEDESGNIPISEKLIDIVRVVLIGTFRARYGDKFNIFKRGTDTFPQVERECYIIESGNLQRLMNLLSKDIDDDKKLVLGNYTADQNATAIADGDRLFQRHVALLGSTGSGKSWAVALILEQASKLKFPNIIVFDLHGEYKSLTQSDKRIASGFKIAGPGDLSNSKNENVIFLPYWLLNREEMLAMLLDRSDMNAPNQASRFTFHVKNLKENTLTSLNLDDVRKTFTVDSPIPYKLTDLLELLASDDTGTKPSDSTGKPVKGDWNGKLTRFIGRLQAKTEDRRYGFMFSPPSSSFTYDWLSNQFIKFLTSKEKSGIKIIDFSEVPYDVLPIVIGVFARLVFEIQFWMSPEKRTPISFFCDEAHLYLPNRDDSGSLERRSLDAFERLAKEGRKYGLSLVVVSQRPSDINKTILSQCNNFIILRLTNESDQLVVRRLMPDSMSGLTDILPLLDVGESLLLGDSILLPTRIKLSTPSIKPDSATKNFWTDWGSVETDHDAIKLGIENLRKQTRN